MSARDWLRGWWKRAQWVFLRRRVERELDEEIAFHVEMQIAHNIERGMDAGAARRAALVEFGGVDRYRERARDGRRLAYLEDLAGDARHALRALRRRPVFTVVAAATLALGIGANSALFGLVNALSFRQPPGIGAADGLVWVDNTGNIEELSYPDYRDLREAVAGRLDAAAFVSSAVGVVAGADDVLRVPAQLVSGGYFEVAGVLPARGRALRDDDDRAGAAPVAVLGYGLWRDRFGGDTAVVGSAVRINGVAFTVVGVTPPGFVGLDVVEPAQLWVPLATQPVTMPRAWDVLGSRRSPVVRVIGRLPGSADALERARAAVAVAAAPLAAAGPERIRPLRPEVVPLRGYVRADRLGGVLPVIGVAGALTVLVLLVACANIANLLLARAVARRREIGIRVAIGAGRGRLVRLLLAEALVLALAAVPAGIAIACGGAWLFQARFRGPLAPLPVSPDGATLTFTLLLALATGVAFGLAPAVRASRPDVAALLAGGAAVGPARPRLQRTLVVSQLAVSLTLLFCAALFLRRADAAATVDPGFDADRVVAVSLDLASRGYDDDASDAFHGALRDALRRVPGVQVVASPGYAPFGTGGGALMRATGQENDARSLVVAVGVGPDWFAALGVPLRHGRAILEQDITDAADVAVISASLADRLWPGEPAVGRRLALGGRDAPIQVVGVAGDILTGDLHGTAQPQVYLPFNRHYRMAETTVLVRTSPGGAAGIADLVRAEVRRIDPHVPVFDARLLADDIEDARALDHALARVVAGLGALALLLASLGLYGVMAFTIAGRTREIGLRVALGARPAAVVRAMVGEGVRLAAIGVAVGIALALAFGRVVASAVAGIPDADPLAAAVPAALLLGVGAIASWIPAKRAARIDPQAALRAD